MNFEEFKQQLMEDLKEALSRRVGTEIAVEENEVHKLQQESYDGIVIRKENESIGVNVDATRLYSDLEQGRAYEDVLHYAVDIAQKGFEDAPKVDISQIMNYEVMKHSLITQLIPVAGNEDMLANIPHKQIEDLALVYRFSVGRDEHGQSTILVKNDMLDRYGITAEQLHEDAMMSAPQIEAPSMKTLFETTAEIMGEDFFELMGEVEPAMPGIYVCTNESKHHGASVLMYPNFMDEVADKLGGDFYIIPSSIHETLLFPAKDVENYHDLEAMVRVKNSDLDVVVQLSGNEREDDLFNLLHEDKFRIGGVLVDINPITEYKTGTLEEYLPGVEKYLEEKAMRMEKKPSVTADLQSKKMQVAGEKKKETKRDCKKSETVI